MIPGWLFIMLLTSRGKFSPGSARQAVKSVTGLGSLARVVDQWANGFGGDSEIPSNLVLRKISPKIWLPALTVMWGIVTMCLGFVRNYAGFMVVRAILGITEGGLLPGIVSSILLIMSIIPVMN
jgi:MFS family permease